jgi:hypothetical protein
MGKIVSHYDPKSVRGNFGAGGFSDQYDNSKMKSMDRDQHPGGVTDISFEDDFDLDEIKLSPEKGESYSYHHPSRATPSRDSDLSKGESGTDWNRDIKNFDNGFIKKNDEKLKEKVSEVLLHSLEVDASDIIVNVRDGVVYLEGGIKSKGMMDVAIDLILSIPRVEDVFTKLKIEPRL